MPFNLLHRNLRAKVTLATVLPLLLIMGSFTVIQYVRHQNAVLNNLSLLAAQSGAVVESSLRHAMLKTDFTEVQALLDTIGKTQNFRVVYLLDTSGRVAFSPEGTDVGVQFSNSEPDCLPCHRVAAEQRPVSVVVTANDGQQVFRSMHPIENEPVCKQCHDTDTRLLGLLLTDISTAPMQESLQNYLRQNLLAWAGILAATVVVVNVVLNRLILRRLEGLASAITRMGRGQLPSPLQEDLHDEIGQLSYAFNEMVSQIEARNKENFDLSDNLRRQNMERGELLKRLITAQEDERKRVARELHDSLGQALIGLGLRAEGMERFIKADADRALDHLDAVRSLIGDATDRMYELIMDLRPSTLDDLGLTAAMRDCSQRVLSETGIMHTLDTSGLSGRLPTTVETTVFRIYQEALNNVIRHSKARHVHVTLARSDGVFEGRIVDDGQGFDPASVRQDGHTARGLGLLGMQERVAQVHGEFQIVSEPGKGTQIHIRIPLDGEPTNDSE